MSAAIHRDEAGALRASGDKRAPSTQTPARHGEKRLPAARSGAVASDWGTDSVREWCLKSGDAHAMTTESGRPPAILCCLRRAARASDGASTPCAGQTTFAASAPCPRTARRVCANEGLSAIRMGSGHRREPAPVLRASPSTLGTERMHIGEKAV